MSSVDLIDSIDKKILNVRTNSLDFSFNELADMYKEGELIIAPEFQRLFRWNHTLQSQFIESVILELPIPPLFVVERQDRKYELIDGLQRMSSWLHFKGLLINQKTNKKDSPLKLINCDIVEDLNGLTFEELPQSIKIKLKRSPIRVEIIGKDSSSRLKYDMFNRLNMNGLNLSPQEIRNSTIRLLEDGDKFMRYIIDLSENQNFKNCIKSVQENEISRKYNHELVLRFLALKNKLTSHRGNMADFMTEFAEQVSELKFILDYDKNRHDFDKTFLLLDKIMGKEAFVMKREVQYRVGLFDAFSIGLQPYLENINDENIEIIRKVFSKLKNEWSSGKSLNKSNGGTIPKKLKDRIQYVSTSISKAISR
ncbi:MAG: hypothetical protein ACJAWV_000336 [Flammeovirgaceae bacterium]|jgi:hypothetical protein